MKYWVNIHHPQVVGEARRNQCKVYIQRKGGRKLNDITDGDLAFIYETGALSGEKVEVEDERGRRRVQLGRGRKGIIALVRIAKPFHHGKWKWHGIPFIGFFNTREIPCKQSFIGLNEIDGARFRKGLSRFNPRIYGGLRELTPNEFDILATLMGFEER